MAAYNFPLMSPVACQGEKGVYYGIPYVHVARHDIRAAEPVELGKKRPDFDRISSVLSKVIENSPYPAKKTAAVSIIRLCMNSHHIGPNKRGGGVIREERLANLVLPRPGGRVYNLEQPLVTDAQGVISIDLGIAEASKVPDVIIMPATREERARLPITSLIETMPSHFGETESWVALRGIERIVELKDFDG